MLSSVLFENFNSLICCYLGTQNYFYIDCVLSIERRDVLNSIEGWLFQIQIKNLLKIIIIFIIE